MNWIKKLFSTGCRFCGGTENLSEAIEYFSYGTDHKFHPECLHRVLKDPEKHGNEMVDIALNIEQCIKYHKKIRLSRLESAREAYKRLDSLV